MPRRRQKPPKAVQAPILVHPVYAAWMVDYEALTAAAGDPSMVVGFLQEELPHAWAEVYNARSPHRTNIQRVDFASGEYLFDFTEELVRQATLSAREAAEDRIVAVHGRATPSDAARPDHVLRGTPRGAAEVLPRLRADGYDRGHFFAHSLGGALYVNIFAQLRSVNRGWSEEGKRFRSMEKYAVAHRSYCFARPIYSGLSAHPAVLEYGVVREDRTLWVDAFPNVRQPDDMILIEDALRELREREDQPRSRPPRRRRPPSPW